MVAIRPAVPPSFEHGIDRVVDNRDTSPPLPGSLRLTRPDTPEPNRLAQMFSGARLDGYLEQALWRPPAAADAHTLSQQRRRLRTHLKKLRHAYPEHETTLDTALAVLNEQDRLYELLHLYKNALYQG
ncbi:hypothetical protein [Paraburkholderia agricolaris]|uniref:type III secretion apparatus assembly protein SctX n=1 Tax=Paraburkholderia agricolaris TaxID=2152888 RepID=UPI00129232AB|nr:hypothetical protein [Paraburkholderia agricolaris]